jgi:ATP-dependent DNA helicase DinG
MFMRHVVIDTEQTSIHPEHSEIVEICLIALVDGVVRDQFYSFVKPPRPISAEALRITKLDARLLASAPTFADIAAKIEAFVSGAPLVSHYVRFERACLNHAMTAIGRQSFVVEWIDIIDLLPSDWPVEERSLAAICQRLGAGPTGSVQECALAIATAYRILVGVRQ